MKVKVTCVREARVTLQQLTATTNATNTQRQRVEEELMDLHPALRGQIEQCMGMLEGERMSLTHSEDADKSDEHQGSSTWCKERLHHVAAKSQGHIGSHSWPGNRESACCVVELGF